MSNKSFTSNSEPDLIPILKDIIKKEYHDQIEDYFFGARVNEKKGIYLISKIISNKGNAVFNDYSTLKPEININEMNFKAALERYKKKSISSTYLTDFYHGSKMLYKNVFQERDLTETKYSEVLNPLAVQYIRNWLMKEACEAYKDLVLDFLRAFYSSVKANRKFVSINRNDYSDYKKHELFSNNSLFAEPKNHSQRDYISIDEMRKILKIDELKEKFKEAPKIVYNDNIENFQFIKEKKQELVRGKKNLLKGIYGSTTSSVYQESFKGQPEKFKFYFKPDIFTSGVKGKIPDPYITKRINQNTCISNELSFKVTGMLNK